jgi:AAA+ superfamily predicted ATPase
MDERLLKPLEDTPAIWIASSAVVDELDPMFANRFDAKIKTVLPDTETLTHWLRNRCQALGISADEPGILRRLAERANGVPGLALHVLNRAIVRSPKRLTLDLVEDHLFSNS